MSRCQEILNLSLNEEAISVKPPYDYSRVLDPHILNGYRADRALQESKMEFLHTREFWVMPVHYSPLMAALRGSHQWIHRYTNSFTMLSCLWDIIQCYFLRFRGLQPHVQTAKDELIVAMDQFDERFRADLRNKPFLPLIQSATIDRIQLLERCIWAMLRLPGPAEFYYTPHMYPDVNLQGLADIRANYYKAKQDLDNRRLKEHSAEGSHVDTVYFSGDPSKLAEEYYRYLTKY